MCSSRIAIIPLIFTIEESADIRPNITGGYSFQTCRGGVYSGALISGPVYRTAYNGNNNSGNYSGVSLDASSDKATYGLSETIQPFSAYSFMIIKA